MRISRTLLSSLALLLAASLAAGVRAASPTSLPIRSGDTVVWLGDSITQQDLYTWYLETYFLTRFPNWRLRFRNAGWSGDTAWLRQRQDAEHTFNEGQVFAKGGDAPDVLQQVRDHVAFGLARDVLSLKPTVVTINFGMNDARGGDARLEPHRVSMQELVRQLKAAGVRVVVLSPSPEQRQQPGEPGGSAYNRMLARYAEAAAQVARAERVTYLNQLQPFLEILTRGTQANPRFNLIPDAVHPGAAGHLVTAWALLKAMGAPSLVSEVEINLATGRVRATGATVMDLEIAGQRVAFTRRDRALPWYLPPETRPVWELTNVLADLDRYTVRLVGLDVGLWEARINGQPVARVSAGELETGWNPLLAGDSPLTETARQLHLLVKEKNQAYFRLWRTPLSPNAPPAEQWRPEAERLTARIAELERGIDALRRRARGLRFEFVPVAGERGRLGLGTRGIG